MTSVPVASIEDTIFHAANFLRVPVLVAALAALAWVLAEGGALGVELWQRRGQPARSPRVKAAARAARRSLADGRRELALKQLTSVSSGAAMSSAMQELVADAGEPSPGTSSWMAKTIADFDLRSLKRLERTRTLVRVGPALGLMGTLIPLSPALSGLSQGNTSQLTSNLRVAFSVTVLGLLIGAIAFWVSLVRDRLYSQDVSDLEAIAAELEGGLAPAAPVLATPAGPVGPPPPPIRPLGGPA